jgi:hypothetical protein
MSSPIRRAAGIAVVCSLMVGTLVFARIRVAHAQCLAQAEDGTWVNVDPATPSLTKAVLRFTCQDQVLNGQPYPPGPPWHIHVWGKCHPTDCDWGEIGATRLSSGWIYGTYNQGFARRYVYARMSQGQPARLRIYTWTDFLSPTRPDYASDNYFHK